MFLKSKLILDRVTLTSLARNENTIFFAWRYLVYAS